MSRENPQIVCRVHLESEAEAVFALLATDEGRASFWAESASQEGNEIFFRFPNGEMLRSRVLESQPPERIVLTYFSGSVVTFELTRSDGGTDLTLSESGVPEHEVTENRAGWISVLLNLKARVDFGIDLRNHDPRRTWTDGYIDN